MASWQEVTAAAPELAAAARALFDAHKHKTLATLRQDGSPRISGIEVDVVDGELWLGGMADSRKVLDLLRDPRFALHSASVDPPDWTGDAKVAGRAVEETDPARIAAVVGASGEPPGPARYFRADLSEVVLTRVGDPPDHLVVEWWTEGRGLRRVERR
jgi:hypothetical protein